MELTNKDKVELIKKYLKKQFSVFELELFNYEGYNLFITCNYLKKEKCYRMCWLDLNYIYDKDIEKYLSCIYIPHHIVDLIYEELSTVIQTVKYDNIIELDKDIAIFNANIKTEVDNNISIGFNKYLPEECGYLFKVIAFIFRCLPRDYEEIGFKILASLTNTKYKYEYKEKFKFDLFNDDIDTIFEYQIIERGKKYYEEAKVKFLEKISNEYIALVEGTESYVVIIDYDDENKEMKVYCSCPCEFYCKHIYAVILAIRNNDFNKFYKISYRNSKETILERMENFNYILCTGIYEGYFECIDRNGEIEYIPVLEENSKECNWKILEDSKDGKLQKELKEYLEKER